LKHFKHTQNVASEGSKFQLSNLTQRVR